MNMFHATYTLGAGGATSPVSVCVMCYVSCVRCGGRVSTRTAPADSGPGPVLHHNTTTHINNNKPHVSGKLVLQKVPSELHPKVRNHGEGPY